METVAPGLHFLYATTMRENCPQAFVLSRRRTPAYVAAT
jgi:hypothetical protein